MAAGASHTGDSGAWYGIQGLGVDDYRIVTKGGPDADDDYAYTSLYRSTTGTGALSSSRSTVEGHGSGTTNNTNSIEMEYPWMVTSQYSQTGTWPTRNGAVHIYKYNSSTTAVLTHHTEIANPHTVHYFATNVAIKNELIATGHYHDASVRTYIYSSASDTWSASTKLYPFNTSGTYATNLGFGRVVALDYDSNSSKWTLLAGTSGGESGVHVFSRNLSTWSYQGVLSASDATSGNASEHFGLASSSNPNPIAIYGDWAAVGYPYGHVIYTFKRTGTAWTYMQKLSSDTTGEPVSGLGQSVSMNESRLVAVGNSNSHIHIWDRIDDIWTLTARFSGDMGSDNTSNQGHIVKIIPSGRIVLSNPYYNSEEGIIRNYDPS